MPYFSPLRYPGGKNKLVEFVKQIVRINNLHGKHYVEPYAGGASVALNLLFHEYVTHIHINDFSPAIYAFWASVLNQTEELCALIYDTPVTITEWHKQKTIQANAADYSQLEFGFSTFFLNRTNRSGIIKGGVIGGQKQQGAYHLDARYNKTNLLTRIRKIASYKDRISLYGLDAADFVTQELPKIPASSLVYFDPPYFVKGSRLYDSYYAPADHEKVAKLIFSLKQRWIVSYDHVLEIRNIYAQHRNVTYSLSYSAASRYRGTEIMFFCDRLEIPDLQRAGSVRFYPVSIIA